MLQATVTADELGATFRAFGLEGIVTGCFGRTDSVHRDPHAGMDVEFPKGSGIPCLDSGVVAFTSRDGQPGWATVFGNSIIVAHRDGTRALYAHLESPPLYDVGDRVEAGAVLGTQGSTGYSTGDHLHLGLTTEANPWFSKDADGGVSRLLNPFEHLEAGQPFAAYPAAAAEVPAEPPARLVAAHEAQYVADAALRVRQAIEDGGGAFTVGVSVDLLVDRALALGRSAKAL